MNNLLVPTHIPLKAMLSWKLMRLPLPTDCIETTGAFFILSRFLPDTKPLMKGYSEYLTGSEWLVFNDSATALFVLKTGSSFLK